MYELFFKHNKRKKFSLIVDLVIVAIISHNYNTLAAKI